MFRSALPVKTLRRIPKQTANHQGKISLFKIAKMWLATIITASLKHPPIVYDNVFLIPPRSPSVPQVRRGSLATKIAKNAFGMLWTHLAGLDWDLAEFTKIKACTSCALGEKKKNERKKYKHNQLRTCWVKGGVGFGGANDLHRKTVSCWQTWWTAL